MFKEVQVSTQVDSIQAEPGSPNDTLRKLLWAGPLVFLAAPVANLD